jgi:hypothetical protein
MCGCSNGHAAIVDQATARSTELGEIVARRAQAELGGDVDFALAEVGERPGPAARREVERPVVAQPVDRDVPHLGAAGEDLPFRLLFAVARDHHRGRGELDGDVLDLGRVAA